MTMSPPKVILKPILYCCPYSAERSKEKNMSVGFQVLLLNVFRVKLKLEMCPHRSVLQEVLSKA